MASLNAVQLMNTNTAVSSEPEVSNIYDRFLRMVQRCSMLLATLSQLRRRLQAELVPPEEFTGISRGRSPPASIRITPKELGQALARYESRIDAVNQQVDKLQSDVESLSLLKQRLSMLQLTNLESNALGVRTFTIVKAGLINKQSIPKLEKSLEDLQAVSEVTATPAPGESLVAIVVSRNRKEQLDDLLSKAGFVEIEVPRDLDPDPEKATKEIDQQLRQRLRDSIDQEKSLLELQDELGARQDYVNFLKDTLMALSRTKDLSITEGWIIGNAVEDLRRKVAAVTSNSYYLEIRDPKRGEATPILLSNKGWVVKGFELLTSIRGTPSYNEIDPTIIFAILFPLMYGMMFGDVGDGAVILLLGLIFYKRKAGFIGLSSRAIRSLGTIMIVGGVSAMAFGVAYGSWFLVPLFPPLLFDPSKSFGAIVEVALAFGVAQLAISLVLNIRNLIVQKEFGEAILGGKGVAGLIYYLLGIVLAVRLIQGGLDLSLFVSPENLPFTLGALVCLLLVFLSPSIRHIRTHGQMSFREDFVDGLGELVEVFISFLTNSLSYLRLAAFAIAHSIFASFALSLGSTIGYATSLLLVNALVIMVDGFAAGIQSVRLLYYEFSTKFFAGSGQKFKPLSLKLDESAA